VAKTRRLWEIIACRRRLPPVLVAYNAGVVALSAGTVADDLGEAGDSDGNHRLGSSRKEGSWTR
jgi:hypothetical protein